ncbi:AraC family transcriptional regulator [Streptomyces sp. NPDC005728]|uniref:AraC family transcriptional regulator n=1 Tax=Streptomyces sp. NPDC005728 TaxID=3157054 RepID=UPI0033EF721A
MEVIRESGAVRVSCLHGPAVEVRGDGGGGRQLVLVQDGELVLEQAGRTARVGPGGLVLLDSGRPYRMRLAGTWNKVITACLADSEQLGVTAEELADRLDVAALVAGLLAGLGDDTTPYRPGDRTTLLPRIQGYILRHLGDDGLTPDRVAAAHHISTRYLHRLFQRQGLTVASWIKAQRLEGCRRDLADPGLCHLPVHVIAARWGFAQAADFSRAFRTAYGTTPTALRVRSQPRNSAPSAKDRRVPAQQTHGHGEARQALPASVHMRDRVGDRVGNHMGNRRGELHG